MIKTMEQHTRYESTSWPESISDFSGPSATMGAVTSSTYCLRDTVLAGTFHPPCLLGPMILQPTFPNSQKLNTEEGELMFHVEATSISLTPSCL